MPNPGDIFDGYTLVRPIGEGGFGQVWLCRAPLTGEWRAQKFIRAESAAALSKEYSALTRYKKSGTSPYPVPAEHAVMTPQGLFGLTRI